MQEEHRDFTFWGSKLLLAAILLWVVTLLVTSFDALEAAAFNLMNSVVIVVVVVCIIAAVLGSRGRFLTAGLGRAGSAAARGIAGAAQAGAGAAKGSVPLLGRPSSPHAMTVRRFRIVDLVGMTTSCVMLGDVEGDLIRQGDLVRVHGRLARDGHLQVRRIDILDSVDLPPRSIVRPRHPYLAAKVADVICKAVGMALVAYSGITLLIWYRQR